MNRTSAGKLQRFIRKWMPVFATSGNGNIEFADFEKACRSLGFEMDCMHSFQEKYPGGNVFRASFLSEIINSIHDVQFLGTAIFSYWRYLTHWHEGALPDDASTWFAIAFGRLSELANSPHGEEEKSSMDKERQSQPCDDFAFNGGNERESFSCGKPEERRCIAAEETQLASPLRTMKHYRFVKRITIAGVRYREDRARVMAMMKPGEVLYLVREGNNCYDDQAIRVDFPEGQKLGYVPRQENSDLAEQMDRGVIFVGIITSLRRHESWVEADIYERLHVPFPDFAGFTLRTSGFFAWETRCSIFPGSRRFVHKTRNPHDGVIHCVDFTFAPAWWEKAMKLIQRCNFPAWESEYIKPGVCDGTQWNITIRRRHAKSLKISGSNAYPEEWGILNDLIERCLDMHEVKGNGRIYLELPSESRKSRARKIPR